MNKWILVIAGFASGVIATSSLNVVFADKQQHPAFMVVGGTVIDAEGMEPYREAAEPLARAAGIKVIANSMTVSATQVLEGNWPEDRFLKLEQFDSMEALLDFWHSDAYQKAIPLRKGKVDLDFVVAVPSLPQS